jgi:hypothetical protein
MLKKQRKADISFQETLYRKSIVSSVAEKPLTMQQTYNM